MTAYRRAAGIPSREDYFAALREAYGGGWRPRDGNRRGYTVTGYHRGGGENKVRLTPTEFEAMRVAQDQRCAICRDPLGISAHIDHDHTTLRIRGLLCPRCNLGLGHFKDDPERLEAAARYLTHHGEQVTLT